VPINSLAFGGERFLVRLSTAGDSIGPAHRHRPAAMCSRASKWCAGTQPVVRMAEDAVSVAHVVKRLFESEKELKAKAKQAAHSSTPRKRRTPMHMRRARSLPADAPQKSKR
jgi:hypothetical protein